MWCSHVLTRCCPLLAVVLQDAASPPRQGRFSVSITLGNNADSIRIDPNKIIPLVLVNDYLWLINIDH